MNKKIGKLNKRVIELLDLEFEEGIPIILGDTNIQHMKRQHFNDYMKYGNRIKEIINEPTYVSKNPNQGSIEYIKEYYENNDLVLVAVRLTNRNKLFARTLFIMSERKKNIYIKKGYVKRF